MERCQSWIKPPNQYSDARCLATKETEWCSCGGDQTKCDFYPEIREKANTGDVGVVMDKQPADLNRSGVVMGHAEFHPYGPIWMIKSVGLDHIEKQELAPARHGRWIQSDIPGEEFRCSVCGGAAWYYDFCGAVAKSKYCPNCGAKMDGGSDNEG